MEKPQKNNSGLAKAIGGFLLIALFFCGAIGLIIMGLMSLGGSDEEADASQQAPEETVSDIPALPEPPPPLEEDILAEAPPLEGTSIPEKKLVSEAELPPLIQETEETAAAPIVEAPPPQPKPKPKKKQVKPNMEVARWVDALHPTGISKKRIVVGGTMYPIGAVINKSPKIIWVEVDTQLGVLTFEDENGVRYEKDY